MCMGAPGEMTNHKLKALFRSHYYHEDRSEDYCYYMQLESLTQCRFCSNTIFNTALSTSP